MRNSLFASGGFYLLSAQGHNDVMQFKNASLSPQYFILQTIPRRDNWCGSICFMFAVRQCAPFMCVSI